MCATQSAERRSSGAEPDSGRFQKLDGANQRCGTADVSPATPWSPAGMSARAIGATCRAYDGGGSCFEPPQPANAAVITASASVAVLGITRRTSPGPLVLRPGS